jgi:hypothetical protein
MSRVVNDQSEPPSDPDPMKKPGADECDAAKDDVQVEAEDLDADDELDFGQEDELQDAFKPEPIQMVESPQDGMPIPVDEQPSTQLNLAPSFSYDNCVCVADDRQYVELFEDELRDRGWKVWNGWLVPPDVEIREYDQHAKKEIEDLFAPRCRFNGSGEERERSEYSPDEVKRLWGALCVKVRQDTWRPVRPIRERCKHYKRQVFAKRGIDQGEFGHYDLYRNCVARRSVGGAFLTVKDEAVYACEYRDPPDEATVKKYLDKYDDDRLQAGPPEEVALFGIT